MAPGLRRTHSGSAAVFWIEFSTGGDGQLYTDMSAFDEAVAAAGPGAAAACSDELQTVLADVLAEAGGAKAARQTVKELRPLLKNPNSEAYQLSISLKTKLQNLGMAAAVHASNNEPPPEAAFHSVSL